MSLKAFHSISDSKTLLPYIYTINTTIHPYRSFPRDVTYLPVAILVDHFSRGILKIAPDPQENVVKSSENIEEKAPIPLSEYANKLEPRSRSGMSKKFRLSE